MRTDLDADLMHPTDPARRFRAMNGGFEPLPTAMFCGPRTLRVRLHPA